MISINFDVRGVTGRKFKQPHKYTAIMMHQITEIGSKTLHWSR